MSRLERDEIIASLRILCDDDKIEVAQSLPSQVLLLALYDKCLDMPSIRQETLDCRQSLLSVHDERGRLGVLTSEFGNMVMTITQAQYQKGERSNGWHDLSLEEMQQKVIAFLRHGLASTEDRIPQAKKPDFDF